MKNTSLAGYYILLETSGTMLVKVLSGTPAPSKYTVSVNGFASVGELLTFTRKAMMVYIVTNDIAPYTRYRNFVCVKIRWYSAKILAFTKNNDQG